MSVVNLPQLIAEGLATVPDVASLPAGQPVGAIRYVEDIDAFYLFDGTSWFGASGGLITSVSDTSTVDLTVALGVLSADVIPGGIDHGGLAGLGDDDHTQYLNNSRADTWLATKDTDDLAEGAVNLYYTNARADARITLQKGAANGLATLDAGSKIPAAQLPNSIMDYLGTWAASTNTPTLSNGTGNAGDVYVASDAGTVNFGAGGITFAAGDWVIYNGSIWEKSVNSNAVASVNGQTGAVSLDTDDVPEGTAQYFTDERAQDAVGNILSDTASVALTYTDGTPEITADVIPGGVDHDSLLNYVANDHIDHTTVSISTNAGSGLSGGGDISASRNLVVDIAGTTALGANADVADEVMIWDVSGTARKKVTVAELTANVTTTPITSKNYLLNSDFKFSQRANLNHIDPATPEYTADRWYSENLLGAGSLMQHSLGSATASIPDSARSLAVEVYTAPTVASGVGVEVSQVLPNLTSKILYNQSASFSGYITALGNVTEVGVQFRYATSETLLASDIGSEVLVAVNTSTPSLASIVEQALGTSMTADGVVGIRIRATDVSSGDLSDVGNGIVIERTQVVLGELPTKWSPAYADEQVELNACRRFFESSYALNTTPGTTFTVGGAFTLGADANGGVDIFASSIMVQKRVVPDVSVWAPDGTAGDVLHYKTGGSPVNQPVTIPKISENLFVVRSPNSGSFMEFNWTADAEIY